MTRSRGLGVFVVALLITHAGCGGGDNPGGDTGGGTDGGRGDGGGADGGGTDGGGVDTGVDMGSALPDMGMDGGNDAGMDAYVPPACSCAVTASGPRRGSAIAISPDDTTLVSVNRDVGSVTITHVDWTTADPTLTKIAELDLGATSEPWEVAIDACGQCAYVVTRRDQRVVRIEGLSSGTPTVGPNVAVGSEPTALALTPNGTSLYATNWVDGTVTQIDPVAMTVRSTVDLNPTLVSTGYLGNNVTARPALAHPRAIAITNDGDADDTDETVLVTEWYAQRAMPEAAATADTTHVGLVYRFGTGGSTPLSITLPPVTSTGFVDQTGAMTGCYPNQLASITISGTSAYVTSTCASPRGPNGVFQKGSCTTTAQCAAFGVTSTCSAGLCTQLCLTDAECGVGSALGACQLPQGTCRPDAATARTTTHPALSTIDIGAGTAVSETLDGRFNDPAVASTRMPLLPTDLGITASGFAYVTAEGADAAFRMTLTPTGIGAVGSATNDFIDLRRPTGDTLLRLPIGIAIAASHLVAFVADDGSRDVTALDLNTQSIAGSTTGTFAILQASALPAAGTPADSVLRGRRFFTTGLGRWSLQGAGWGACAACHIDGLTDGVTWYFARGPRQSTSLDGSFASLDATDQRIFNWTAVNDEVADFEGNVRNVSGGIGAIVSTVSMPIATTDRINLGAEVPPQQGLQGSSSEIATPSGTSPHPHSAIADWGDITHYIQSIRSPRAPTTLVASDVAAGAMLFADPNGGNCVGCHSGPKWTISRMFYTPGDIPNAATASTATTSLGMISWNASLNGFPAALFPATTVSAQQVMRQGNAPAAEQLQCALRPVGTFGVSDPAIGVLELRQDMVTAAQGNADPGRGYNVPSLLGLSVGGGYFHAGNARTLEEVFDTRFLGHHQSAVAQVFNPSGAQVQQLVAFLLSIDESTMPIAIPARGARGGDLCHYP